MPTKLPAKPPAKLDDKFYKKLVQISKKINIKPEDLLLVMYIESGLDPQAKNPSGSASGLTQIMPSILPLLGFSGTSRDFAKLPAEKQLDYIEKYFVKNLKDKNIKDPAQIYLSNFLPATLNWKGVKGKKEDTILAEKGNFSTYAQTNKNLIKKRALTFNQVYEANKGLDLDKDGNISYGDIKKLVELKRKDPIYQAAVSRMKEVGSEDLKPETDNKSESGEYIKYISNMIDEIKKMMGIASDKNNYLLKEALFQNLPSQNILIKITSSKLENNLELARILSEAFEDVIISKCSTYTDNKDVEVLCSTPGKLKNCYAAIDELTKIINKKFNQINNCDDIKISITANKKPSYKHLSVKTAEINYRKFLFNQIGKYNGN